MVDSLEILKINKVTKKFGGVTALEGITFSILKGECHAIVGENGAGKTTLLSILSGALIPDSGYFEFDDQKYEKLDPGHSISMGINVIHQELALVESLSVMENIFLPQLGRNKIGLVKSKKELIKRTNDILNKLGTNINPEQVVETLSTSKKQIIEIAKTLVYKLKLLIMDEPTASLTQGETEKLFEIVNSLKKQKISIIFVSHRLEEIFKISDRISVLRDGKYIGTVKTKNVTVEEVIKMMVGKQLDLYKKLDGREKEGEKALEVMNLTNRRYFKDINFFARCGEILSITGLVGAGRSEMALAIFGVLPFEKGEIKVFSKTVKINSPKDAINIGIGLLPEDRKILGVISTMTVKENISLTILPKIASFNFVSRKKENNVVNNYINLLNIKTSSADSLITSLSGGNQQKVVLARWLAAKVRILIVDEPTQGIDVGAKFEIRKILRQLADEGVAVIIISSDLPEILSVSDRILIMRRGQLVAELNSFQANKEKIMTFATMGTK